MTDKPFPCPKCNRRFATEQSLMMHKGAVGHGRRGKRRSPESYAPPMEGLDPDFIYEMVDAMDLPDGAHWAMIEELSGLEPGDFA